MKVETIQPVLRSVVVDAPIERAFEVFTERLATWWPLDSHSISGDAAGAAVIEGRVGGEVYECTSDGKRYRWARVLAWEPPHRIQLEWELEHANALPATEIEIRFLAEGSGTRVELEHRGWERVGDKAAAARESYGSGWESVLGCYEDAVARP